MLFYVKDLEFFHAWLADADMALAEQSFDMYVTARLSQYMMKLVIPFAFAIYSYASYKLIRVNTLFVFMWSVLILGGLAYNITGLELRTVFFPAYIVLHLILLLTNLSLVQVIRESKLQ
ncbi:hypothetical protein [Spirochaeta dissipatitropha]